MGASLMNTFAKIIAAIIGIAFFLALSAIVGVASAALMGWVLVVLWSWFVIPVFGLPALHMAYAVGLMLLVRYMTIVPDGDKIAEYKKLDVEERTERLMVNGALAVAFPLFVLGIGWIIHQFV